LAAQAKKTQPSQGFEFDFNRWPYPLHAEVNERLGELARKYPKLAKTEVIGKTVKGRPLTVITITNFDTGSDESKPAIWLDANIHAGEITGRLYLMYFIERLLYDHGKNSEVTRLVDTRTFYVLPAFDADGGELVLTRHPAWKGHVPEEHLGKDLDGDGYIMWMRVKDDSVKERFWIFDAGYRYYPEGADPEGPRRMGRRGGLPSRDPVTGEREETDFNRNWSAEWKPTERGAGPFPFSQPEVHAVATFLSSHRNIFFVTSIHSGGGGGEGRSYLVRPPMNHAYVDMHHEDNDWYIRAGAVWSHLSEGMIIENNYASFLFNTSQEDEEGNQVGYAETMVGFMNDWVYMHLGIHAVIPEISGSGIDYDGDGYFIPSETARWHKEVMGNKWLQPWKPYDHPQLGKVEIGGERIPPAIGERAQFDSEAQFDWYLYVADQAPVIKIADLKSEATADGNYRVTATVQNQGWLSTYVTRNAIEVKRDYPAVAEIDVKGGNVVGGEALKGLGHILGKHAFIRYWVQGEDRSTKTVEWTVEPAGSGPLEVTVTAMAPKGGRDQKTIRVGQSRTSGN
jgi:hypothetical protein